jgi:hypothetical protein
MAIKSIIEQMEWEEFNRVLDEHVDSTLLEDEEPSKASKQLHLALLSTWEPPKPNVPMKLDAVTNLITRWITSPKVREIFMTTTGWQHAKSNKPGSVKNFPLLNEAADRWLDSKPDAIFDNGIRPVLESVYRTATNQAGRTWNVTVQELDRIVTRVLSEPLSAAWILTNGIGTTRFTTVTFPPANQPMYDLVCHDKSGNITYVSVKMGHGAPFSVPSALAFIRSQRKTGDRNKKLDSILGSIDDTNPAGKAENSKLGWRLLKTAVGDTMIRMTPAYIEFLTQEGKTSEEISEFKDMVGRGMDAISLTFNDQYRSWPVDPAVIARWQKNPTVAAAYENGVKGVLPALQRTVSKKHNVAADSIRLTYRNLILLGEQFLVQYLTGEDGKGALDSIKDVEIYLVNIDPISFRNGLFYATVKRLSDADLQVVARKGAIDTTLSSHGTTALKTKSTFVNRPKHPPDVGSAKYKIRAVSTL